MGSSGINKVIIVGNVGTDPEVRTLNDGKLVANFSVATSDKWRDKQTGEFKEITEWHRVVVYGGAAKIVQDYVRKGTQLYLEGKLRTNKWKDKDGVDRSVTEIHITIDGKLQMMGGTSSQGKSTKPNNQNSAPPSNNNPPPGDYSNMPYNDIGEDDIPF